MMRSLQHVIAMIVIATGFVFPVTSVSIAQDFEDANIGLPNLFNGTSDWGDYDNDGDLDLLVSGFAPPLGHYIQLFDNNDGEYSPVSAPFPAVSNGSVSWGDYNNDGYLDILIVGYISPTGIMRIYENDGDGGFFDIEAEFPETYRGKGIWGDYDNDGDLDIATTFDLVGPGAAYRVFRNDGGRDFYEISPDTIDINRGSIDFGDYDNDGDLDILIIGQTRSMDIVSRVYRYDGEDRFTDVAAQIHDVCDGGAEWGDYDNDGDLDILFNGTDSLGNLITGVYRNDGDDNFVYFEAEHEVAGIGASATWADYDNDGDLDFLIIGAFLSKTVLFRNDGSDVFTRIDDVFPNGCCGSVDWGDYDGDGDLDLVLSGIGINPARMYRNNESTLNNPPSTPTGLVSEVTGNNVTLAWEQSDDDHLPSVGLTYNLRIGSQPGGLDIVSPMSDPVSGFRQITVAGNAGHSTTRTIRDLRDGTYYWSVQAVDNSFSGSSFTPEESFTIGLTAIDDSLVTIRNFEITGAYPNPFNSSATLEYYLPEGSYVTAAVYDLLGQKVTTLVNSRQEAGSHRLNWQADDYSSGVYFVRVQAGEFTATARMSLLK